jgi:hypothetical protein
MSKKQEYTQQVRLLVRLVPIIAKESCFALKGGTAINLSTGHSQGYRSMSIFCICQWTLFHDSLFLCAM